MDGGSRRQHATSGGAPGKRLRDDEQLWEELSYCVPLGIPHSVFLDWEPDDQDKALALMRDRNTRCGCGTRASDWKEDPDAYIAWQRHCPGCDRIEQERKNLPDNARGVHVILLPKEEALRRMASGDFGVVASE